MIVLDTHAWIWWVAGSDKLSRRATRAIAEADVVGTCSISCWELAMLVTRGRLELDRDLLPWVRQALALPRAKLLDVSPEIGIRAGTLDRGFHGDPADRLIVATSLERRAPLITRDERIRSSAGLQTIW